MKFYSKDIHGISLEYLFFTTFNEHDINLTWVTKGYFPTNQMEYRKINSPTWLSGVSDTSEYFPTPSKAQVIHHKRINGLDSDSVYEIKIMGEIRTIKTPPTDGLKIAFFSDNHNTLPKRAETLSVFHQIQSQQADIVVCGGDLTSVDGKRSTNGTDIWLGMLEDIQTYFKKGQHHIPFLVIPGNHEFTPFYSTNPRFKYYFNELFKFSEGNDKFYGSCRIGNKLNLLLLDSAHATSILEQEAFVENELLADFDHVLPFMHVSPYQSSRARQTGIANDILTHWMPHFHDNGVKVVFDGHSHARKRTVKVKNDQPDANGVIFCGDGPASYLRTPYSTDTTWFLDVAVRENAFWIAEILGDTLTVRAINTSGNVVDEFIA